MEELLDALEADGFGHYLAGFVDGEGSFLIRRQKRKCGLVYTCDLSIGLRVDDTPILEEIRDRTGLGIIWTASRYQFGPNCHPQSWWKVGRKDEVAVVV